MPLQCNNSWPGKLFSAAKDDSEITFSIIVTVWRHCCIPDLGMNGQPILLLLKGTIG